MQNVATGDYSLTVNGLTGPITEVRRSYAQGEPPGGPELAVAPDPPSEADE